MAWREKEAKQAGKIKLLIDVEVDTEDLRLLKEHPKEHVATKREAWKLEQLFLLLENAKEMEERL